MNKITPVLKDFMKNKTKKNPVWLNPRFGAEGYTFFGGLLA